METFSSHTTEPAREAHEPVDINKPIQVQTIDSPDPIARDAATSDYRWLLAVVAALIFAADQWSKALVIQRLALGETWRPLAGTPILEWFAFTHTKNSGAAFGIFPSGGWFFVIVAVVVSLGILWYYPRLPRDHWWLFLALGLQLGGALGNLADRLRIGHVTDFVHIGNFAIFNVADSAVVCGVLILGLHMWQEDAQRAEREARAANAQVAYDEPLLYEAEVYEAEVAEADEWSGEPREGDSLS